MTGKIAHLQDKNRRESQNFKGNVRARSAAMVNKGELHWEWPYEETQNLALILS
jgi:hypothetical protein